MLEPLRIFAHRGASSQAPENTLAAIALTKGTGTDWFEFDVGRLKDGALIVIHDDSVDRTTNGSGHLSELITEAARKLDAGSWFSNQYRGEPLPLLSEVIAVANKLGLNMNLEMKSLSASDVEREAFVADVLRQVADMDTSCGLLISSFDHGLLEILHDTAPNIALGYLIEVEELLDPGRPWLADALRLGCADIHPPVDELTSELVGVMRTAGLGVNVWTVNDPNKARQVHSWGATGIFTDEAKRMVAELAQPDGEWEATFPRSPLFAP